MTGNLSVTSHRHIIRIAKVCEYGNAKNVIDEVESLFRTVYYRHDAADEATVPKYNHENNNILGGNYDTYIYPFLRELCRWRK